MPSLEYRPMIGSELSPEEYIRENFQPSDRIAFLVLNRHSGSRTQRVVTAQALATESWQRWLRAENAQGADIYVTWNRRAGISFLLTPVSFWRPGSFAAMLGEGGFHEQL